MEITAVATSPILTLPEEKIFPDEALWREKKIEWVKLSEVSQNPLPFLAASIFIMTFFTAFAAMFAIGLDFPPAMFVGGGFAYLGYKFSKTAIERMPIAHDISRARILRELNTKNILVEDLCKRVSASAIMAFWHLNFTKEEKEQFQKALVIQARENPLVFFDHFEVQYAMHHGYRKLVMVDGLYQLLKNVGYSVEKEVMNEIEKNIHLVPLHVLLLNYSKLQWIGLKLDNHPKLAAFLKKQEEKFSRLELSYRRVQEIIEKLKIDSDYKRPKEEDLFLSIFTKATVGSFSKALFISNWQVLQKHCDQWFYRQLLAIEGDFIKYKGNNE